MGSCSSQIHEPWFICEAHKDVDLQWLEEVAMESMRLAVESMVE